MLQRLKHAALNQVILFVRCYKRVCCIKYRCIFFIQADGFIFYCQYDHGNLSFTFAAIDFPVLLRYMLCTNNSNCMVVNVNRKKFNDSYGAVNRNSEPIYCIICLHCPFGVFCFLFVLVFFCFEY